MGGLRTTTIALDISYYPDTNFLGFSFMSTVEQSVNKVWANMTGKVCAQTREAFGSFLDLYQCILYVHSHLLAKIWHTGQVFPAPSVCNRQLVSATSFFI